MHRFFLIMLCTHTLLFAQSQTTIAVLDLEALGIDPSETSVLSNRLRSLLVNLGDYKVVERSRMEEILNEQGLQQTGCTSDECVVEVGKLLGVQKMLAGSFGKFGNVYTLELRIIDVQTGKIESSTNYDYRSEIENLLVEGVETALRNLLTLPIRKFSSQNEPGSLQIVTTPEAASIYIDDKSYGSTPVFINTINSGYHDIFIQKEGFITYKEKVIVKADTLNQLVISLQSKFAWLEIKSKIQNAEIFINYQSVGKNLFRGERLEPGKYHVEVKHDFYKSFTDDLELKAGDKIFWDIDLTPAIGQLKLDTKINNINMILRQGKEEQKYLISKSDTLPVKAGNYLIELHAMSYYPYQDKIKINGDDITELEIELKYGGDDLKMLQNQRRWYNISSIAGLVLAAGSLYMANQMYSNYENATKSSDAAHYKDMTQTFTYMTYGFSVITSAVSIGAIYKWSKIDRLKYKLGLR
ncbi:MAG: PEGA domain-containing protein [Calditrichaceae bacterium]|nr:PEGA domain-containing protein [Calditrichaceae bacterium]